MRTASFASCLLLGISLLQACGTSDSDGDGIPDDQDCGPDDPVVGGLEVCDGNDNDCDGLVDNLEVPFPASDTDVQTAAGAHLAGYIEWGLAGRGLVVPGDVNGDGYDDLLISSTWVSGASPLGTASMVYLVHGPLCGTRSLELRPSGASHAVAVGRATLNRVGDVDQDGFADISLNEVIVFGPIEGPALIGEDARMLRFDQAAPNPGLRPVRYGSDFNGDGIGDLVFSDPSGPLLWDEVLDDWRSGPGRVAIFFGPFGPGALDVDEADVTIEAVAPLGSSLFGWSLATPGDLNGDGLDDLVIGSWGQNQVVVFQGPLSGRLLAPEDASAILKHSVEDAGFGVEIAGTEDRSGDGRPGFVVGTRDGRAYGFEGLTGAQDESSAVFTIEDFRFRERSTSLTGGADFDSDGQSSLVALVGEPGNYRSALLFREDASMMISGSNGILSVAEPGDINGDGIPDLIIGTAGPGLRGEEAAGGVAVVYGSR